MNDEIRDPTKEDFNVAIEVLKAAGMSGVTKAVVVGGRGERMQDLLDAT